MNGAGETFNELAPGATHADVLHHYDESREPIKATPSEVALDPTYDVARSDRNPRSPLHHGGGTRQLLQQVVTRSYLERGVTPPKPINYVLWRNAVGRTHFIALFAGKADQSRRSDHPGSPGPPH